LGHRRDAFRRLPNTSYPVLPWVRDQAEALSQRFWLFILRKRADGTGQLPFSIYKIMNTAGALLRGVAAGLMVLVPVACVDLTPPWDKVSPFDAGGVGGAGGTETGGLMDTGGATGGTLVRVTDPGAGGAGGSLGGSAGGSSGQGEVPDAAQLDPPVTAVDCSVDTPVSTSSPDTGGATAGQSTSSSGGTTGTGGTGKSGGTSGSGGKTGGTSGSGGTKATSSTVKPDAGPDANPLLSGLLLYYTFESVNGATIADQSGNGNHGTLKNDAIDAGVLTGSYQLGAGKVGQGLTLIRKGSGYIAMPPEPFRGLNEITIATWVNIVSATDWQRLFDIGIETHTPFNPRTGSKYMNLAPEAQTANMSFGMSKDGLDNEHAITTTSPSPGVWTHVAVVLAADGSGKLYVDGVLAASNALLGLHPSDLGAIDYASIGKSPFSKDPYLDAEIDEFRVYNRALSQAEVLSLRQFTGP
jgi:hypothetical protein